jgi:xylan 1,4-beta-xylosidase
MSYWTFSDLFEEPGPQTKPFEGGFGLMTPQGVRKATWFAYKYLAELGDRELPTGDDQSIAAIKGRTIQLLAWRDVLPDQPVSNRPFFSKVRVPARAAPIDMKVGGLKPGSYRVTVRRTGFRQNDAYTAYLEMGRPTVLTKAQLARLQTTTQDPLMTSTVRVRADGTATLDLPMRDHDVVMVELTPA